MAATFSRLDARDNLHDRVTRTLALQIIRAERDSTLIVFPNEAALCDQLGVSRSILREAIKVLSDKGMVWVRPRWGTRARPREDWNLLDPDILSWHALMAPDARLLRDLCEVRLAIEPTAAGFAAVRATAEELAAIEECLRRRENLSGAANPAEAIELDLEFYSSVVAASHNVLLQQLTAMIREPFRTALSCTVGLRASEKLALEAHNALFDALKRRDAMRARSFSEEIIGLAMLAVEQALEAEQRP
jgi:DNA-binding FadR family transcriptional regulator